MLARPRAWAGSSMPIRCRPLSRSPIRRRGRSFRPRGTASVPGPASALPDRAQQCAGPGRRALPTAGGGHGDGEASVGAAVLDAELVGGGVLREPGADEATVLVRVA